MTTRDFIDSLQSETGYSLRKIAERAQVSHSTLIRQTKEGFKADTVLALSRALGLPFLDLAVRAEVLTSAEADVIASNRGRADLSAYSDEDLAREMLRRARQNKTSVLNGSLSNVSKLSVLPRTVDTDADQYMAAKTDDQDDVREEDYPDA